MSRDEDAVEPGYFADEIEPGQVERLVLRFPAGDILVLPEAEDSGGRIGAVRLHNPECNPQGNMRVKP